MPVTPLDILIAHKAINLSANILDSDKRVAGVLLDHFNRRTAQCDPSLDSVADLAGMSRRTVMRAVGRLEGAGFFRKIRHGGKFHRNLYEPVWSAFRNADAQWCLRRKNRRSALGASSVSPLQGRSSHFDSASNDHQTCSSNLSKETSVAATSHIERRRQTAAIRKGTGEKADTASFSPASHRSLTSTTQSTTVRSSVASRDAAERRWNNDLLQTYGNHAEVLGHVVDAIDYDLMLAATDAELRRSGSGLTYLIRELNARDLVLRSLGGAVAQSPDGRLSVLPVDFRVKTRKMLTHNHFRRIALDLLAPGLFCKRRYRPYQYS